jgi:hypothetical protein
MSDEALLREAARCRRLAAQATDPKLASTLEQIAREYESRAFQDREPLEPTAPDNLIAFRRA